MTIFAVIDDFKLEINNTGNLTRIHQTIYIEYEKDNSGTEDLTIYKEGLKDDLDSGDFKIMICEEECVPIAVTNDSQVTCQMPIQINTQSILTDTFDIYDITNVTLSGVKGVL